MSGQPWTADEDARLRAGWGTLRNRELAAQLGRSMQGIRHRAQRLGLDANRHHTPEQIALVRALYPSHTAAAIAQQVYSTPRAARAVYRLAVRLGLRKQPHLAPELIEEIRRLHATGLTDTAIGRQMKVARETVTHVRHKRLALPRNASAIREAYRRGVARQRQTLGIRNAGELRALAYRRYARENGWPEELRPREVQILNVLAAAGVPLTNLQLAEAIGHGTQTAWPSGKRRILLSSNGPGGTYTASLVRKGYLIRLARAFRIHDQGKGKNVDLYALGPLSLSILQERAEKEIQCPQPTAATP